jgi:hypothetical protein
MTDPRRLIGIALVRLLGEPSPRPGAQPASIQFYPTKKNAAAQVAFAGRRPNGGAGP